MQKQHQNKIKQQQKNGASEEHGNEHPESSFCGKTELDLCGKCKRSSLVVSISCA